MAATAAKTAQQIKEEFNEKLNKELMLNELKNKFLNLGLNTRYVSTFEGAKKQPILNIELNADRFSRDYEEPTKEELKQAIQTILEAFPATEEQNNLRFAGKEEQEHKSPFKLTIENPAREQQEAKISYASTECEIWITYNPFTMFDKEGQLQKAWRSVTSSEYHYFTGWSQRKINDHRIPRYSLTAFKSVNYYGGSCVAYIESSEDRERFENLILKGE